MPLLLMPVLPQLREVAMMEVMHTVAHPAGFGMPSARGSVSRSRDGGGEHERGKCGCDETGGHCSFR